MTTSPKASYKSWVEICGSQASQQAAMVRETYETLARLNEVDRATRLLELESALYRMDDSTVRAFTKVRFQALLSMDPLAAKAAAAPYPTLIDKLPGTSAMRHFAVLQTIARDFTPEEQSKLKELFPRALASKADVLKLSPQPSTSPQGGKPWWAFWKKTA